MRIGPGRLVIAAVAASLVTAGITAAQEDSRGANALPTEAGDSNEQDYEVLRRLLGLPSQDARSEGERPPARKPSIDAEAEPEAKPSAAKQLSVDAEAKPASKPPVAAQPRPAAERKKNAARGQA